jgi:hypothetical protein
VLKPFLEKSGGMGARNGDAASFEPDAWTLTAQSLKT